MELNLVARYTIKRENDNKTVLTIQQIDEEDVGNYTCYAINRAGWDCNSTIGGANCNFAPTPNSTLALQVIN